MSSIPLNNQAVVPALPTPHQTCAASAKPENSYGQILKSTAWIGGSSVVNIIIGIARTKAMAMILGPGGFGLAGLYMSVANVAQSVAGMGINSSGVRQIAEAVGSQDRERIARTATVLRRTSLVLGLFGALLLVVFAKPISTLTFGDGDHATGVYILAFAVLLQLISAGQNALIQGMRRISDLAKGGAVGALLGTLATIAIVYYFRERGVAPSLVAVAAMSLLVTWWYSRKIPISPTHLTGAQIAQEASALLKLGTAFMVSSLLMMVSAYLIRIVVMRKLGLEATGLYQSAWTIGGLYLGMVLQSMGADFYPRLTGVISDHSESNRLVNEQARIAMLLAGPGVVATLTLAPLAISLCYAANFGAAANLLRWICLGIGLRAISWPMGFIIMAKGMRNTIMVCDAVWAIVHILLAIILIGYFGLDGAGMAFFGSYVVNALINYIITRRVTGFAWSDYNKVLLLVYTVTMLVAFCAARFLPEVTAVGIGGLLTILVAALSAREIMELVPVSTLPRPLRPLLTALFPAAAKNKS